MTLHSPTGSVVLRYAAVFYGLGTLLHTLDHLRRGIDEISPEVFWAGNVSTPIAIIAIFLAAVGYRYAPLIAVVFGFPHAFGIAAVHVLPHWGVLSDSLSGNGADALSWVAVWSEILGAFVFALAGVYALRGAASDVSLNRPAAA